MSLFCFWPIAALDSPTMVFTQSVEVYENCGPKRPPSVRGCQCHGLILGACASKAPVGDANAAIEASCAALRATLAEFPDAQIARAGTLSMGVVFTAPIGFRDLVEFSALFEHNARR